MKKLLAPIIVAGFLCANLAISEAQKQEIQVESEYINEEYIHFYEMTIDREDLTDRRRIAYRNSYRTFILSVSEENFNNNPYLYEGLAEE